MNLKMIRYIIGWVLIFEAIFFAVPVITAIIYGEKAIWAFLACALFSLAVGRAFTRKKPKDTTLYSKEGYVIVALAWIVLSLVGAVPFVITKATPTYIDAIFEIVSGFTTTGSSIMTSVEALPYSVNIWRCFSHWVGGMGVLVFLMAFLPLSGGQNMHILKAESPGPDVSKLVPRVKKTALILYAIYAAMTVILFLALVIEGMPVFDALCTSFGTAGTGGFGIKNDSIASYSTLIQVTVTVGMLLFSVNFNSYFLVLHGKIKDSFTSEVRAFFLIVIAAIGFITLEIYGQFESVGMAVNHAAFSVASLISTTGYMSTDFDLWPAFSKTILVLVIFIGACAGSTGGGLKVSRVVILLKGIKNEIHSMLHPRQIKKVSFDGKPADNALVRAVLVYFACYIIMFTVLLVLVSTEGHDLVTSFTAVATTFNNVGPGLNMVGPTQNFAFWSPFSKLVFSFAMLAGRLELFPMLVLFYPKTWKRA